MTVLNINNIFITTIADSYVQINYSLSLSLLLFIIETCKYQLPMILNDLNSNDIMSEVIKNINNASLLGFQRIVKIFFFIYIGIHLYVVFQIAMSVDRHVGL